MGDITKNLSRHEFACQCGCGLADPHPLLVLGIQDVFDTVKAEKVLLTSGSRCLIHISGLVRRGVCSYFTTHGVKKSLGGYTLAGDCVFQGVKLSAVVAAARTHPTFAKGGLGLYVDETPRVHLDVRGVRARWGVVDGKQVTFQEALTELFKRE